MKAVKSCLSIPLPRAELLGSVELVQRARLPQAGHSVAHSCHVLSQKAVAKQPPGEPLPRQPQKSMSLMGHEDKEGWKPKSEPQHGAKGLR